MAANNLRTNNVIKNASDVPTPQFYKTIWIMYTVKITLWNRPDNMPSLEKTYAGIFLVNCKVSL